MIAAKDFVQAARQHGFTLYSGVPCSYLKPFINHVIDSQTLRYVGAANEGDAVAIAAGAELGGQRSVAMCQNSGLGNAVNPLTSLTHTFRIPILFITTLRGEPDGPADEPQHELMGGITTKLLELMEIPWAYFPDAEAKVEPLLRQAVAHMDAEQRPFALVLRKGSVAPSNLSSGHKKHPCELFTDARASSPTVTRREILMAIQAASTGDDIIIATTGYTGRELYTCGDRPGQFYMVGSMGCAASVGLGLAIAQPQRRVIVIDGDGAALMRLGAMSTIGYERPSNLVHILLDNGMHESTGGQATVSGSINFCALARASGYPHARAVSTVDDMRSAIKNPVNGLSFIHAPILPGLLPNLPRPDIKPPEVAARLREFLQA